MKVLIFLIILYSSYNRMDISNYGLEIIDHIEVESDGIKNKLPIINLHFGLKNNKIIEKKKFILDPYYDSIIMPLQEKNDKNNENEIYCEYKYNKCYAFDILKDDGNYMNKYFSYYSGEGYLFLNENKNMNLRSYPKLQNIKFVKNNKDFKIGVVGLKYLFSYLKQIYLFKGNEMLIKIEMDGNKYKSVELASNSNEQLITPFGVKTEFIEPKKLFTFLSIQTNILMNSYPLEIYMNSISDVESLKSKIKDNCVNKKDSLIKIEFKVNKDSHNLEFKNKDLVEENCKDLKVKIEYLNNTLILVNIKKFNLNNFYLNYFDNNGLVGNNIFIKNLKGNNFNGKMYIILFSIIILLLIIILIIFYYKKNGNNKEKELDNDLVEELKTNE